MVTKKIPKTEGAGEEHLLFPEPGGSQHGDDIWGHGHDEGQLAVDVYERPDEIVMQSAIAGVRPDDFEVFVHNDMLTVRGKRKHGSIEKDGQYLVRECHWGAFSRSIILPTEVDADGISATIKNGILTVRMPKLARTRKIKVKKL